MNREKCVGISATEMAEKHFPFETGECIALPEL